jgi:hypothetical protein
VRLEAVRFGFDHALEVRDGTFEILLSIVNETQIQIDAHHVRVELFGRLKSSDRFIRPSGPHVNHTQVQVRRGGLRVKLQKVFESLLSGGVIFGGEGPIGALEGGTQVLLGQAASRVAYARALRRQRENDRQQRQ